MTTDRKSLLLLSPSISGMYLDIISQLHEFMIDVDYIEDKGDIQDPDFIRVSKDMVDRENKRGLYEEVRAKEWVKLLSTEPYTKKYDYFLVIDGMSLSAVVFDVLKRRNKNIYCVNYLYDSTRSLYRFQKSFPLFDLVASFDRSDCIKYGLSFLPIYWVQVPPEPTKYTFFAIGSYSPERYNYFTMIDAFSRDHFLDSYIKLYHPKERSNLIYIFKYLFKVLFSKDHGITPCQYYSKYITTSEMLSSEYRKRIMQSEIIVDIVKYDQDGMTARFMWALGLGKRIITTNKNFTHYECYDPNQVLVLGDTIDKDALSNFLDNDYKMSSSTRRVIDNWRIDYWLRFLLAI